MGKYEGSWSGMRRYLEHDMLAPCLYGRVRYGCTAYVGMDGSRIFEICIDGRPVKHFSLETVNTWFLDNGYRPGPRPVGLGGILGRPVDTAGRGAPVPPDGVHR